MDTGLEKLLARVLQEPLNATLSTRFLRLVAESPDDNDKCQMLLKLAQCICMTQPETSIEVASAVYRYAHSNKQYEAEIHAIKILIASFKGLQRFGKATALKNELGKLEKEYHEYLEKSNGAPTSTLGEEEAMQPIADNILENSPKNQQDISASDEPSSDLDYAGMPDTNAYQFLRAALEVASTPSSESKLAGLFDLGSYGQAVRFKLDSPSLIEFPPPATDPQPEDNIEQVEDKRDRFENDISEESLTQFDNREGGSGLVFDKQVETSKNLKIAPAPSLQIQEFWRPLYIFLASTDDKSTLPRIFPHDRGMLNYLHAQAKKAGFLLADEQGEQLIKLLENGDYRDSSFAQQLTLFLWHDLSSAVTLKLLTAADLSLSSTLYFGYYLDLLLKMGRARRALHEIRSVVKADSSQEWAMTAFDRLPLIFQQLKLVGVDWDPRCEDSRELVARLAVRTLPVMAGLCVINNK